MSPGPSELLVVLGVVVVLLNTARLGRLARRIRAPHGPHDAAPDPASRP